MARGRCSGGGGGGEVDSKLVLVQPTNKHDAYFVIS